MDQMDPIDEQNALDDFEDDHPLAIIVNLDIYQIISVYLVQGD